MQNFVAVTFTSNYRYESYGIAQIHYSTELAVSELAVSELRVSELASCYQN